MTVSYISGEPSNVRQLINLWFAYNADVILPADSPPADWIHYLSLAGLHRSLRCPIILWPQVGSDQWGRFIEPVERMVWWIEPGEAVVTAKGRFGKVLEARSDSPQLFVEYEDGAREWMNRAAPLRLVSQLPEDRVPASILQRMADYTAVGGVSHG